MFDKMPKTVLPLPLTDIISTMFIIVVIIPIKKIHYFAIHLPYIIVSLHNNKIDRKLFSVKKF